jgi:hypothetical protein
MDSPLLLLALVLLGVAVVATAITLLIRRLRRWMLSRFSIDGQAGERLSAELLDYVKTNSFGEGHVVDLRPFWRRRGLNEADKHLVIDPLLSAGKLLVLKPVRTDSFGDMLLDGIDKWTDSVLFPLPPKVVLNPQDYQRMLLADVSSTTIIGEIDARHFETNVDAGAGARVVTIQGVDGDVHQDVNQGDTGISGAELERLASNLATALRLDATGIDREEARQTALELARDAEQAADSGDENRVVAVLRRARDGIRMFGSGMNETRKVVDQFGHLLNDL